jgi:hypothetical protein
MKLLAPLALAAVLALAAALPSPSGAATTKKLAFSVDVTGIHVVDWSDQPAEKADCRSWSAGTGTQTIGFSTPRKLRYSALMVVGKTPIPVPRFQLLPTRTVTLKTSVDRKADWTDHTPPNTSACTPCGPTSEYGPCSDAVPDPAPLLNCGRRTLKNVFGQLTYTGAGERGPGAGDDDLVAALTDTLDLSVGASPAGLYTSCPPDWTGHTTQALHSPAPLRISFVGAKVRRLKKLAVGRSVTLKEQREVGYRVPLNGTGSETQNCSKVGGPGYTECAVTDVTLKLRRTR